MNWTGKTLLVLLAFASLGIGSDAGAQPSSPQYMGVKTCAHCHGAAEWTRMSHYTIWSATDPHRNAYKALENDLSKRIADWMGLPADRPEDWGKCLRCHSTAPSAEGQGAHFSLSEGVSCEACHGAAEDWFVPHLQWDASHKRNVDLGLVDLKNLETRARVCLGCHQGLDHEIVAAGHPDLSFELFHFSFWQPPHWESEEASPLAFWAVGQAVALEEALKDLNQALVDPTTGGDLHVEVFDDKACYRCHHKLSHDRGRYVEAHYRALAPLLKTLFEDEFQEIETNVSRISDRLDSLDPGSQHEAFEAANRASGLVAGLVPRLSGSLQSGPVEEETIRGLMEKTLVPLEEPAESKYPRMDIPHAWMIREYNSAEQKYYALKCLGLALASGDGRRTTGEVLRALETDGASGARAVDELWTLIDSVYPEERRGFTPGKFNDLLEKVSVIAE